MGVAQLSIKRLLRPRSALVCNKEGGSRWEKEFKLTRLFCGIHRNGVQAQRTPF